MYMCTSHYYKCLLHVDNLPGKFLSTSFICPFPAQPRSTANACTRNVMLWNPWKRRWILDWIGKMKVTEA